MKSALVIAAALALCGSAFAATGTYHAQKRPGVMASARQEAHQIGSSFRHDMHSIARADKFRQEQAADQRVIRSRTRSMGAGPSYRTIESGRQSRLDAAYADWQRSHR